MFSNGKKTAQPLKSRVAVAQSVERATPGEEVSGLIPAVAARSLLVEVVVSIIWPAETEVMLSQLSLSEALSWGLSAI